MNPRRHRKLSLEVLAVFQAEARARASMLSYRELAELSGLKETSVKQLMAQLIKEACSVPKYVSHETYKSKLGEMSA